MASPSTAPATRIAMTRKMLRLPDAAISPAVMSRESPGRKKPANRPVSAKIMMKSSRYPPQRISSSSERIVWNDARKIMSG